MGVGGINLHNVLSQRFFLKIFSSPLRGSFSLSWRKISRKTSGTTRWGWKERGRGTCTTVFFAVTFIRESGPQA